jgi:DNA mismatch repair protein MutL
LAFRVEEARKKVSNVIQLLPESVANQIAAGEVVQRPASAVKELMENAIDAGATSVKLVVKDAGKTLIQVIDNGCGMSEMDARMCFERHATSKITKSEDLFHITTKGFRGEALASVAAIAQVEVRTRRRGDSLGTAIEVEGSKIKQSSQVSCPEGTQFQVKNLFFNVPARRYFLKSDAIELRHMVDEFQRIAFTHPDVEFQMVNNGTELFALPRTTLRQRIVHVLGNRYNEKLVPVEELTDIVNVTGFIGKPDAARKTRGEQFFFVNERFIKSQYLHHAVMSAFEQLLPQGTFPLYLLYLELDPAQIDINIHPTKTEIKFQDERSVYAILHAAVRRALGKFSIAPSLDFEQEQSISISPLLPEQAIRQPEIQVNPGYNPFGTPAPERSSAINGWFRDKERKAEGWKELYEIVEQVPRSPVLPELESEEELHPLQVMRRYIVCESEGGMLVVDQQRAHQRILFERYKHCMVHGKAGSQQLLFPEEVNLAPADMALLTSLMEEMHALGFAFERSGEHSLSLYGVPADTHRQDYGTMLEELMETVKEEGTMQTDTSQRLSWALARSTSVKYGQMLTEPEMKDLLNQLWQCEMPGVSWNQKKTLVVMQPDQLQQLFL